MSVWSCCLSAHMQVCLHSSACLDFPFQCCSFWFCCPVPPRGEGKGLTDDAFTGIMERAEWQPRWCPADKNASSLSGRWRIHMEIQPWTEKHWGSGFHGVCCGGWCSRVCTCIYVFSFWISRNSQEVGENRVNSKHTLPTLSVMFEESHHYQFIWYLL